MNVSAFIPIKKFSSSKNRLAKIISSSEREILAASMAKKTIDTLNNSKICKSITVVTNDSNLHLNHSNSYFTNSSLNDGLNEAIYTQTTNDIILIIHADLPRINERDLHELAHSFDMKKVSIISDLLKQGTNCLMFNSAISFDLKFGFNSYNLFTHEFKNNGLNYQDISIESLQDDLDSEEDYFKLIKYINS
ncbi:2-phospho-L-lactate guanylyltransferase [Gammaproteobacteria bacterium]|nr:2-phospho-L-lactate guanylyltransferase [Gammaproteobacteria bacterium]